MRRLGIVPWPVTQCMRWSPCATLGTVGRAADQGGKQFPVAYFFFGGSGSGSGAIGHLIFNRQVSVESSPILSLFLGNGLEQVPFTSRAVHPVSFPRTHPS